ncbi:translation initiation factor IF-2 [Candidatus Saccharibacteria bacterium RIFCSPHIGHO2_12_FULL_49_19]|nr:MAG: translation initiation factor IF-2 [Candidatus Saccharibacteria bacterium RIFCSPHIGHO2_01_FULL_49_21]OGL37676.1 MAG: translation initiation factor IF-2 [Candidatus Saccharibacteria bacterium RIFCSPHIGHO2_12_FULL_49_19]OGL37866.1 MAG: translation initiation factor IF-2 [Candidatus Saccharibacteria bacterium RIFCSPLOWO2_01_FULL_49_22]
MAQVIEVGESMTVGELAGLLQIPVSKLIAELLKNGVMATVNEKVDFDTAQIVVGELELDVELAKKEQESVLARPKRELSDKAEARPPVIAMMGHIDHGKTSLLDAIRGAETTKDESGGITQHLSAYQIKHNDRYITFLDTPGHEAFAALREHGARLTDLAVIVVAADDGVKPQTLEAIRFAKGAGVKMIVAANKMDKSEADLNRLKQQLAEHGLNPEDYGGDTVVVPVSAKTKEGISELLDMILLVTDLEELKAEHSGRAEGLVIESHMDKGLGRVAVALIEQGALRTGNFVQVGATYGKIRTLQNTGGEILEKAGPSMPVIITGLKNLPEFGDEFVEVASEKEARERALRVAHSRSSGATTTATTGSELLRVISRTHELTEFNIVLKADVQGSLTSVADSLKSLDTEEVAVRVVSSGVGIINESDLHTASSSRAIVYGFNVSLPAHIKRLAARDNVSVRIFSVIYELIDDVKRELEALLRPEVVETDLGKLIVKGVFKTTKTETIAGGEVTVGKITLPALARVKRDKEILAEDLEVTSLKKGPTDAPEVNSGEMCGFSLKTEARLNIAENDRVEFYTRQTKIRTL